MRNLFGITTIKTPSKILIGLVIMGIAGFWAYKKLPEMGVGDSVLGNKIEISAETIDNLSAEARLPLPSKQVTTKIPASQETSVGSYVWMAEMGMTSANGGMVTTQGSIMETNGVRLRIVKQDMYDKLLEMNMNFVRRFHDGVSNPSAQNATCGTFLMGDGGPYYAAVLQNMLDEQYGKGKYHVKIVGAIGMSLGEDKLIGPREWIDNPQLMIGKVISVVIGDGDWVTIVNWCFANNIKVNTDHTTYDATAVNFIQSNGGDYMNSAKELVASQINGKTFELNEVVNGKLTGNVLQKKVDGCGTWSPGDELALRQLKGRGFTDVVSTKRFNNQMATTFITIHEWASVNRKQVTNILKSAYIGGNQFKLYDEWKVRASESMVDAFQTEQSPKFWYDMIKGVEVNDGVDKYSLGGSKVFNLADAKQYYGLGEDGEDRYKKVYEQVSKYLTDLNPMKFNTEVGRVLPYDEVVDKSYLQGITLGGQTGTEQVVDYSKKATEVFTSGNYKINFGVGRSEISSVSYAELDRIVGLIEQAENTKVVIEGYTDSTGDPSKNQILSESRAYSVKDYLVNKGVPTKRIQEVVGYGSAKPISDNTTEKGRSENRRTTIKMLNVK